MLGTVSPENKEPSQKHCNDMKEPNPAHTAGRVIEGEKPLLTLYWCFYSGSWVQCVVLLPL